MTAQHPAAPETHTSPRHCPFLGIPGDDTTYYQYPSRTNHCYVPNRPEPIRFEHQETFCLTSQFPHCPVYRVEGATNLPPEIRGIENETQNTRKRVGLIFSGFLAISALIALGIFILIPRFDLGTLSASNLPTETTFPSLEPAPTISNQASTPTSLPILSAELITLTASASSTSADTATAPPPSPTPLPAHTATRTLVPTPTFTSAPTFTPTYFPSPVPGFGTPYATDPPLVIHIVAEGQSFTSIANQYQTTPEVLAAINPLISGQSLWVGLYIVVPVGVSDATGLPRFTVYLNTEETTLTALAAQFNADPELIRRYNALGPVPEIPAARYFIIPLP